MSLARHSPRWSIEGVAKSSIPRVRECVNPDVCRSRKKHTHENVKGGQKQEGRSRVSLSTYEGRKGNYDAEDIHALFVANETEGTSGVKASESVTESPRSEVARTMSNTTQPEKPDRQTPTCDGQRHKVRTGHHYKEVVVVTYFVIGKGS